MSKILVAAGALNQTPLDWDSNASHIRGAIGAAKSEGVQLLCLPELCISGYGCEDAFHSQGVVDMSLAVLEELTPETEGIAVSLGLPLRYRGGLFNCACLIVNGVIAGFVGKQNLAGEGLHYEPRWFKPWPNDARGEIEVFGKTFPIGDLIFDVGGIRIGFEICEDAWVLDRTGAELAEHGVDLILNPSASHFAFGKHAVRKRLVLDGSRAFCASYIYANHLGNEAGRAIYDGDTMIASVGQLLASGIRLSYSDFEITSATIDLDDVRTQRARNRSFPVDFSDSSTHTVIVNARLEESTRTATASEPPNWETGDWLKEEEFLRAEALGLFDYLRKSRSHGFVVSLSGGADSAAVACLVGKMVELGVAQLGHQGFLSKLNYLHRIQDAKDTPSIVHGLLTCVYQATRNSGEVTRHAAESVARGLHADYYELDVDALVQGYIQQVSESIGRDLSWETDDLALQNIQARVRGPSVWMFANIRNALLLATSNRSEAAVGYATMDGDTCGGVSPVAGIDKNYLRRWLRWLEIHSPDGLTCVPALNTVNAQRPTAELRPQSAGQTDEADLMPYDLLDVIERAAIRDRCTPNQCFDRIEQEFPQYGLNQLLEWTERFFQLWCRNQWKRERYAPSFHLDDENLDPKTWCRFPILSGGYQRELRTLRTRVEERIKSHASNESAGAPGKHRNM